MGLDYVPFDGYIAELHKGERVLTAEEAEYVALAPRLMTAQYAMGAGTSAAVAEPYGISNGAINISLGGMTFNIDAEVAANSDSLREALFHASDEFGDFIINKIEDYYYDKARRAYK